MKELLSRMKEAGSRMKEAAWLVRRMWLTSLIRHTDSFIRDQRVRGCVSPAWARLGAVQPTLALFDAPPVPHRERVVADAADRVSWLRERARGVTATDVARLTGEKAVRAVAMEKLLGSRFGGNAFTQHGRAREPEIGRWVARHHPGMRGNTALFHADGQRAHLATPDGIRETGGALELCEIKTTRSAWRSIPRHYLRQVWWQQYVLGAERTLVVWEQHEDFVPLSGVPETRWVDRDENEIHRLVQLADQLLAAMRR